MQKLVHSQSPAPGVTVEPIALDRLIDAYISDYVFEGDDGLHELTIAEQMILCDALHGWCAEYPPVATPTPPYHDNVLWPKDSAPTLDVRAFVDSIPRPQDRLQEYADNFAVRAIEQYLASKK